jgi:hypothetical protein
LAFVEVSRINPNKVVPRLQRWSQIDKSDLVVKTLEDRLDNVAQNIYKAAPKRTGYLRSTVRLNWGSGHKDYVQVTVLARYAYYVSEGMPRGGNRRPNPFWRNNVAGLSIEMINVVRQLYFTAL